MIQLLQALVVLSPWVIAGIVLAVVDWRANRRGERTRSYFTEPSGNVIFTELLVLVAASLLANGFMVGIQWARSRTRARRMARKAKRQGKNTPPKPVPVGPYHRRFGGEFWSKAADPNRSIFADVPQLAGPQADSESLDERVAREFGPINQRVRETLVGQYDEVLALSLEEEENR